LGFVVDASTSLTPSTFNKIKTFIKDLVNEFDIREGETHVAAIAFGDTASVAFDFNQLQGNDLTRENLARKIDEIPQVSGSNRLDLALRLANTRMFSFSGGKRDKTPRVILLITVSLKNRSVQSHPSHTICSNSIWKNIVAAKMYPNKFSHLFFFIVLANTMLSFFNVYL
jgi:hypothetical protein